jgi:3-oxoadipate enol-lactonase
MQERDIELKVPSGSTVARISGEPVRGTVILLHALGLNRLAFEGLRAVLSPEWRVVSFDQVGHGALALATDFELIDFALDAESVLETLGEGQIHILGHALGGSVAAVVASRIRAVESLIAVTTPARGLPVFESRAEDARRHGIESTLEMTFSRWFGESKSPQVAAARAYGKNCLLNMRPEGYASGWKALASFEGYESIAARLPPFLCISASDDLSTPPSQAEEIKAALVRGGMKQPFYLEIAATGGHMLPLLDPAFVARAAEQHWFNVGRSHV